MTLKSFKFYKFCSDDPSFISTADKDPKNKV